jgi:hypothetical protein
MHGGLKASLGACEQAQQAAAAKRSAAAERKLGEVERAAGEITVAAQEQVQAARRRAGKFTGLAKALQPFVAGAASASPSQ